MYFVIVIDVVGRLVLKQIKNRMNELLAGAAWWYRGWHGHLTASGIPGLYPGWGFSHSKLPLGVSVHGCLSLCGPVMDWRSVQGVPRLSSSDSWDKLLPPPTLNWIKWVQKMDGWSF